MRRSLKISALVVLLFCIVGVTFYYIYNPKKALNLILPNLNEVSFLHVDLKKDSALVKVFITVQNKMPYKMVIDSLGFEMKLNKVTISKEVVGVYINQKKHEMDTIEIPIHLSIKQIRNLVKSLQHLDSVNLDLNTFVVYNTFTGQQRFHLDKTIKIETPITPELKVLKIESGRYNLRHKTAAALIKIQITNKGKYLDLKLENIQYNLKIKNTISIIGTLKKTVNVKPKSSIVIDIPIVITYLHPLKTALLIARNEDKVKYTLNIQSELTVNNIKNSNSIPIEINAKGNLELVK